MRGRTVLFLVLAVAVALLGVYVGRSTTTPTAIGEPATTTQADSPVGPTHRRGPGSGPSRTPTSSPPKAPPPKAPPPNTGPVRFGKVTTPSVETLDVQPTDHRALTATYRDRELHVLPGATKPATRSFAMTLPLTYGAKGETLGVYVQGTAYTKGGANAALTLNLNGHETVRGFPSGSNESYVAVLKAPATPGITYQLSGVLEAHPAPGTDAEAYLSVTAVDASIS